jgi:feruloyl esterase
MKPFLFFLPTLLTAATPCQILGTLSLPDTRIEFAQLAGATTMLGPGSVLVKTPEFCRVGGVIRPSSDSEIHFEVWLPASGWNSRFRGTGNGGFAGSINYSEMAAALRDGYATASTDTGHRADGIDADWALGHPEKITDFGYRAIHEMTVKAKAVIEAFYGEAPKHSFFSSCSNGGRQALMEAQRFPQDYDGILAGAPANDWTHLLVANFYAAAKPMLDSHASYISKDKIPAIAQAVLAACDAADGLKDGILSNPPACHFDPAVIICKGVETKNCLTQPEAASLKRIYAGAHASDGTLIYPGYEPGGEDGPGGWSGWITGSEPGQSAGVLFSTGFLRNMVFSNPSWASKGTNLSDSLSAADSKMAGTLNSTNADLTPFQARGGKLILYHGWSDAAIPPLNAISYYQNVTQAMGDSTVNSFVRLYLPPGMQHCAGGPGPNLFGQFGVLQAGDAQHDIFTALVDWVEKGSAPDAIIATKYAKDDPAQSVEMTRPLCPYPLSAKYDGSGDDKKAESFTCAAAQ